MKERPIIFNSEMARAILDGRKTQTRRVIKALDVEDSYYGPELFHPEMIDRDGEYYPGPETFGIYGDDWHIKCPYGQPGDRLWVKERIYHLGLGASMYADQTFTKTDAWPWKRDMLPSIFCPRGLSRIDLEVTGVRVERVQEISHDDILKEGVVVDDWPDSAGWDFSELWDAINAKRGYGWDTNPWVWVVEFKVVRP